MDKAQRPPITDGMLPTAFVRPDQAGRLSQMLELRLEQAAQVAGGASGLSSTALSSTFDFSKVRLCRVIACRILCRLTCQVSCSISCMVATPQLANKAVLGG